MEQPDLKSIRVPELFITPRLRLRSPVLSDAVEIFHVYAQDREVTRFLTWEPVTELRNVQAGTIQRIERHRRQQEFSWVITAVDTKAVMGMLTILPIGSYLECGFVLGRAFWNKGFMTEALRAVAFWAKAQPDACQFLTCCDTQNHASARVLEKAGFIRTGVLNGWAIHPAFGQEARDYYCYVLHVGSVRER